jgi:outer membrane immunogenic protein
MHRIFALVVAIIFTFPAIAADIPVRPGAAPAVAPSSKVRGATATHQVRAAAALFNWSGFYLGFSAGHAWSKASASAGPLSVSASPKGWLLGVEAMALKQFDTNWVAGLGIDYHWSQVKGSGAVAPGVSATFRQKGVGTARVIAGYAVDGWLPYVEAGLAYQQSELSISGAPVSTSQADRIGWTLGAGVKASLPNNLYWSAGYRFSKFDRIEHALGIVPLPPGAIKAAAKNHDHAVMFVLGVKF